MVYVLSQDMLNVADLKSILSLNKDGYVHITPKIKKISIIDLGMDKKEIMAFSDFNLSMNIFNSKFNTNQLLSLDTDAYVLSDGCLDEKTMEKVADKIKELIGKKSILGIGLGKVVLGKVLKDMGEEDFTAENGIWKHHKYKIYCIEEDKDIDKLIELI